MEWLTEGSAWVSERLSGASGGGALVLLLLGGLLASLLPCVYPLYPITVGVLRARSGRQGPWAPLAYYAGLSSTYFALGVAAGLSGGAFNQLMRWPSANLAVGALMLVLALSTVGVVQLPWFSGVASNGRPGLLGTALMGAGAGILSSACVGPIVVSLLLGLATTGGAASGAATLGAGLKMLVFGLGVGAPVVVVGVLGVALPRGGPWMVPLQWVFGALIGALSLGYLVKGLSGFGFEEKTAEALLLGAALVVGASYYLQSSKRSAQQRVVRSVVGLAGLCGALMMGRQVLGQAPERGKASADTLAPIERDGNLTWFLEPEAAYAAAARAGKPVFVDFYGSWCTNCRAFQKRTQSDPELNTALASAVLLKIYDTSPAFSKYKSDQRFPELNVGLPFFLITDAEGHVLYKTSDFTRVDEMKLFLSSS